MVVEAEVSKQQEPEAKERVEGATARLVLELHWA
jgi:hypothetical protein